MKLMRMVLKYCRDDLYLRERGSSSLSAVNIKICPSGKKVNMNEFAAHDDNS
jgi:hypothetical protein